MSRPYDYIGIRNVFVAQLLAVAIILLSTPLNVVAGKYDSGGVISEFHLALWSVCTVGWISVGGLAIVGLSRMRRYSRWFWRAWRMMILIGVGTLLEMGAFGAAILMGPMRKETGIEALEDSYRNYWLFMSLLVTALVILGLLLVLVLLFNRLFLWGCAEISGENGHQVQKVTCRLLFPMGVLAVVGCLAAVCFYYYQSLNSTVDSRVMGAARLDLMMMAGLWGLVQLMMMVVTWRTWRIGEREAWR